MTFGEISCMSAINDVNEEKVNNIAQSIKEKGWVGCPILVANDQLITGSHRLAALKQLEDEGEYIGDMDVAEDVTDIVEAVFSRYEEENGWVPELDYQNIGWIFEGTWVEQYKNEIEEW